MQGEYFTTRVNKSPTNSLYNTKYPYSPKYKSKLSFHSKPILTPKSTNVYQKSRLDNRPKLTRQYSEEEFKIPSKSKNRVKRYATEQ